MTDQDPQFPVPENPVDEPAPFSEVVAGFVRTSWPWILSGLIVVAIVGVLAWGANRPDDPLLEGGAPAETQTTPADGLEFAELARQVGEGCLELLVADSTEERASGLRHRESELERVDGMLFVYDAPQGPGLAFTMAGVVEPLDIGFYGPDGDRLGGHSMVPCEGSIQDCPRYEAPEGFQHAIETAPGGLPDGPLGGECQP